MLPLANPTYSMFLYFITSKEKQGLLGSSTCHGVLYAASAQRNPQFWRGEIMPKSFPGFEPANSTFYTLFLEIKEWQYIWLTRRAARGRVKNLVKN
jgi:hypothetical protein